MVALGSAPRLHAQQGWGGRTKLLFVLPSLGGGGAERASIDLLRGMPRERWQISLALFERSGSFLSQLPDDVEVHDLRGRSQNDPRLVWRLARLLRRERPVVVFSVLRYSNLVTLLARRLAGSTSRVVINEQNLPSAEFALFGGGATKGWALRHLYPQADTVTAISHGIADELASRFGVGREKLQVIPNPVDLARVQALGALEPEHPWFALSQPVVLGAGRLHRQKGFDHLIRAFALARRQLPCKLIIIGEGPQRQELEQLVAELGLSDDVALPGFQDNPYSYMRRATLFVLSSLYEGFGNVLVDALALGRPIVSTRCPVGPDEILTHEQTGILVPPADDSALAQAMLRMLTDDGLRQRLSANGAARAADFALERIVAQYEALFAQLARGT